MGLAGLGDVLSTEVMLGCGDKSVYFVEVVLIDLDIVEKVKIEVFRV